MADVKPEISHGIYVEFQRHEHILEQHGGTNVSTVRRRRVSEKLKMAACNRKWIWNDVYLSLYS